MKILVTGGMGYIGAHVVDEIVRRGYICDVIDCSPTLENYDFAQERADNLWNREVQEVRDFLPWRSSYDAVIHLAASISVEESTREPSTYWRNNLTALMELDLLQTDHLIFASTGTAFNPTNPYARTKVACESYIHDVHGTQQAWFAGHTIFRFYNVSGLKQGIRPTGQPTHLIRIAAEAAKGLRSGLSIFGMDYPTRDGTAVRDYIHVEDIAASIVNAVEVGPANTPYECLGSGTGSTVMEVVQSMQKVTGAALCVTMAPRRAGDDASTVCPTQYRHIRLSKTLEDMCLSAYENL
jgi:UDP-glucose 4-epimerase